MKLISGTIAAVVGGIVGAAIWALVVKFSGWEIGWLAWGIGALVGVGFRVGARDLANPGTGLIAAAVALLAVLGGKYAVVHLYMQEFSQFAIIPEEVLNSEEFIVSCVADSVIEEWDAQGRSYEWPEGLADDAPIKDEYPAAAWTEAERRWAVMSPEDQQSYREQMIAYYSAAPALSSFSNQIFLDSFSFFDLLWIVLAVGTAFSMGAKAEGDE